MGAGRSGTEAVPSKCSVLMSSLEIKMKKHGLCPPRALGLVESITCQKANLTQYHNCFGGVYVRGDLGGEERVPTSAWKAQGKPQRGGSLRAENRKKHRAFLRTKSEQSVHGNICGDVERRNAGGTGKRYVGYYTARIAETDRLG